MRWILLLVFLAIPGLSSAQGWTDCSGNTRGILQSKQDACYLLSGTTDSSILQIQTALATLHFNPDAATEGQATAQVYFRRCQGTTVSVNTCGKLVTTLLDGGDASTFVFDIPQGNYYVDVVTSPGADTATVRIRGH